MRGVVEASRTDVSIEKHEAFRVTGAAPKESLLRCTRATAVDLYAYHPTHIGVCPYVGCKTSESRPDVVKDGIRLQPAARRQVMQ